MRQRTPDPAAAQTVRTLGWGRRLLASGQRLGALADDHDDLARLIFEVRQARLRLAAEVARGQLLDDPNAILENEERRARLEAELKRAEASLRHYGFRGP